MISLFMFVPSSRLSGVIPSTDVGRSFVSVAATEPIDLEGLKAMHYVFSTSFANSIRMGTLKLLFYMFICQNCR